MGKRITRGWTYNGQTSKYEFQVYDANAVIKPVFNEDGELFQKGVKITPAAADINSVVGSTKDARKVQIIDGSSGKKACYTNGYTLITGGTGIADLTIGAPVVGDVAVIRLDSYTSGDIIITAATGVTFNADDNNTITFSAANGEITLVYLASNKWAVVHNSGGVLSGA